MCTPDRRGSSGLSLVEQVRVKVSSVPAEPFQTSALAFDSFLPCSRLPFAGCCSWNRFRAVSRADTTNSLICPQQGSREMSLPSRLMFLIRIPWKAAACSSVKACSTCPMDLPSNTFKILFCHLQTLTFPLKHSAGSPAAVESETEAAPET